MEGASKSTEDGALGRGAYVGMRMHSALVLKMECCKQSVAPVTILRAEGQMLAWHPLLWLA